MIRLLRVLFIARVTLSTFAQKLLPSILISVEMLREVARTSYFWDASHLVLIAFLNVNVALADCEFACLTDDLIAFKCDDSHDLVTSLNITARFSLDTLTKLLHLGLDLLQKWLDLLLAASFRLNEVRLIIGTSRCATIILVARLGFLKVNERQSGQIVV